MGTETITVCSHCAAGIVNDDWTWLDGVYLQEEADNKHVSIMATLELLGWLTPVGPANDIGYHRCPVCGEDEIDGYTFETNK